MQPIEHGCLSTARQPCLQSTLLLVILVILVMLLFKSLRVRKEKRFRDEAAWPRGARSSPEGPPTLEFHSHVRRPPVRPHHLAPVSTSYARSNTATSHLRPRHHIDDPRSRRQSRRPSHHSLPASRPRCGLQPHSTSSWLLHGRAAWRFSRKRNGSGTWHPRPKTDFAGNRVPKRGPATLPPSKVSLARFQ